MSYTIERSNGTSLGTIADGTYNNSATSLTLVGRNFSNYGQYMTNNLVRLLENSSNNISPSHPLSGQLWYDYGNVSLKVYTGTDWKLVGGATSKTTAPSTTVTGDFWWDSDDQQLYVYNGSAWIEVGPGFPVTHKTGAITEAISDGTNTHYVSSIYADGARVGIISKDATFTPSPSLAGFTTISPGYNSASGNVFWGLANNSSYLGSQPASNYLRSDTSDSTDGVLTINNNGGLVIGTSSNLQITATAGAAVVKNVISNSDINFNVSVSGVDTTVLAIDGATGSASFSGPASVSGTLGVTGATTLSATLAVTGVATFNSNVTAPTQALGVADTTVATTAFVVNNSGFLTNKIYAGGTASSSTTYISVNDTGTGNALVVIDDVTVATASASGFNLSNGATAVTQPQTNTSTGNARVATTQYVNTATQWWDGSAKYVSTSAPNPGVNDVGSADGDFWFQREA